MPIEDIKVVRAPSGWSPSKDQAARIAADARLRRMSRDDQYMYFNQKPTNATPVQRAATAAQGSANNAMSWHPKHILEYVTKKMSGK